MVPTVFWGALAPGAGRDRLLREPPPALILMGDWCGSVRATDTEPNEKRGAHRVPPGQAGNAVTEDNSKKVVDGKVLPLDGSLLMGDPFSLPSIGAAERSGERARPPA